MKKMLAVDYDQTFYINDNDLKKNIEMVQKFRDNKNIFVIATGRDYDGYKDKINYYNIKYDYAIINHGATILDKNDNIIFKTFIDKDIISLILADADLRNCQNYSLYSILYKETDKKMDEITKIEINYYSKKKALDVAKKLNEKYDNYINAYYVTKNSVEIISNKTNKAEAINIVQLLENIDNLEVFVIGDGYSDIEMVKKFNGYCMEESILELKKIATKEYSSVSLLIKEILKEN